MRGAKHKAYYRGTKDSIGCLLSRQRHTVMYYNKIQTDNSSVYAPPNKYGYKININHPKILPLYQAFKRKKKALILSDEERHEFEEIIFRMIEKRQVI